MPTIQCAYCKRDFFRRPSQIIRSKNSFCSASCAARYNNPLRAIKHYCLYCNTILPIHKRKNKFCDNYCQNKQKDKERFSLIEKNNFKGGNNIFKKYLVSKVGRFCFSCKIKIWNNLPIPLELNHINGNPEDNRIKNLELICPNCHAQTPNYKSKNRGNGRYSRMKRYYAGKSY